MPEPCWYCRGTGTVECDYCQGIGFSDGSCPACSGEGRHTCPECNGSGVIRDEDEEDDEDLLCMKYQGQVNEVEESDNFNTREILR